MTSMSSPGPGATSRRTDASRRSGRREGLVGITAFALFAVLWAAFAAALIWSQGSLDQAWAWIQGLPPILELVVGLLLLPVVVGLWIWETTWPLIVRLGLVGGIGVVNLYTFLPRDLLGGRVP